MKKRAYRDVSANGNAFAAVFLPAESSFLLCLISLRILVFSSCEIIERSQRLIRLIIA